MVKEKIKGGPVHSRTSGSSEIRSNWSSPVCSYPFCLLWVCALTPVQIPCTNPYRSVVAQLKRRWPKRLSTDHQFQSWVLLKMVGGLQM